MEQDVSFDSDGRTLAGVVHTPDGLAAGERRPAFLVLHGFGSNKSAGNTVGPARMFCDWGYVTLRFDMRGCGDSEGAFGHIICLDQVADTRAALTYMAGREDVDGARIGVVGSSFGAAVAVYTAGIDERVAAVVSSGGWGDGERKFRGQHPTQEAWTKFTEMLKRGREHFERTGESLMVDRYDIVPMPQHLRKHLAEGSVARFPAETAQSMFDFRADDVVGDIAPRPLLLLHSSQDSVTPTEQSVELFKRAGTGADLHLFADTDHFMFAASNKRVHEIIKSWLDKFFPVNA